MPGGCSQACPAFLPLPLSIKHCADISSSSGINEEENVIYGGRRVAFSCRTGFGLSATTARWRSCRTHSHRCLTLQSSQSTPCSCYLLLGDCVRLTLLPTGDACHWLLPRTWINIAKPMLDCNLGNFEQKKSCRCSGDMTQSCV